jgi:hypothetical protein
LFKLDLCTRLGETICYGKDITFATKSQPPQEIRISKDIVVTQNHTCLLTKKNDFICWDKNEVSPSTDNAKKKLSDIYAANARDSMMCVINYERKVRCFDDQLSEINSLNGLGDGFEEVTVGSHQACARSTDPLLGSKGGKIACWADDFPTE